MAVSVARLTDPKHLIEPDLQSLFIDAFANSRVYPKGFAGLIEDVIGMVQDHEHGFVLLGLEDEVPKALCIITLPVSQFAPLPQVLHFYNGGSLALRKILIKAGVELLRERGYMKFHAVNATNKPDSVWARTFRLAGKSEVIGGIVEFDIRGE